MIRIISAIVGSALATQAAAAPVCFNRVELQAMAAVAVAPASKALVEKCAAFPGATPLLQASLPGLETRFATQRKAAAPMLAPKLLAAMNLKDVKPEAAIEALAPLLGIALQSALGKIDEKTCRSADVIVGPLLAIDDSQLIAMLAEIIILGGRDKPSGSFKVCE